MGYHIEENTVQETLVIPLFARKICSEHYPDLLADPEAARLCAMLDYDFDAKKREMESAVGLFGALEVAQRHYDLRWEVCNYLNTHPQAAVVNLGCGLDDTFSAVDNGTCRGYNIDLPDVIAIRNQLLPPGEREENLSCDLNDFSWMEHIDGTHGAVFFAAGVFYYFKTRQVQELFSAMSARFPGGVVVFDACNRRGAKLMRGTWLKEAGITDVRAYFSLEKKDDLRAWEPRFAEVTSRSYMRGYRDIYPVLSPLHKLLLRMCDSVVAMRILRIRFREG